MPAAKASAVGSVHQDAGDAVDDRLERAAAPQRHDGPSARLRFDRDDAEVFFAGQQDRCRATVELAHLSVGQRPEKLDISAEIGGQPTQASRSGPIADDAEREPRKPARLDGQVDALVGHERRHDQQEPAPGPVPGPRWGSKTAYRPEDK